MGQRSDVIGSCLAAGPSPTPRELHVRQSPSGAEVGNSDLVLNYENALGRGEHVRSDRTGYASNIEKNGLPKLGQASCSKQRHLLIIRVSNPINVPSHDEGFCAGKDWFLCVVVHIMPPTPDL